MLLLALTLLIYSPKTEEREDWEDCADECVLQCPHSSERISSLLWPLPPILLPLVAITASSRELSFIQSQHFSSPSHSGCFIQKTWSDPPVCFLFGFIQLFSTPPPDAMFCNHLQQQETNRTMLDSAWMVLTVLCVFFCSLFHFCEKRWGGLEVRTGDLFLSKYSFIRGNDFCQLRLVY